uniref:Uncharacterized protein n=1 Tax=Anguilla anguilla TaxID=7936 RepID=A0A0E9RML0_ANGAN
MFSRSAQKLTCKKVAKNPTDSHSQ